MEKIFMSQSSQQIQTILKNFMTGQNLFEGYEVAYAGDASPADTFTPTRTPGMEPDARDIGRFSA
jgi:hypothetical protein